MSTPDQQPNNAFEIPGRYAIPAGYEINQGVLDGYEMAFSPFRGAADEVSNNLDTMRTRNGFDAYGIADVPNPGFSLYDSPDSNLRELPGFVGVGEDKEVFEGPTVNGIQTVLKRIRLNNADERAIVGQFGTLSSPGAAEAVKGLIRAKLLSSVAPLAAGQGTDSLEQLVALDVETGFMTTQRASGNRLYDMSGMAMMKIRKRHIEQLSRTLANMRELGLHPHNLGGIFFDSAVGFNFADYVIDGMPDGQNPVPMESTEDFVGFVTANNKALNAQAMQRAMGVPRSSIPDYGAPTGITGIHRASLLRYARDLDARRR